MATEINNRAKPSGILTLFWAVFFFLIFGLIVTFWVRCSGSATVAQDDRAAARLAKRQEIDRAAAERLQQAGVIDKAKGIAHLPIAEAKKLMVAELKAKTVGASQLKVEPPLPMPPPADPNATEPPPMALPSAPQGADTFRFQQLEASAAPNEATPAPAASEPPTAVPAPAASASPAPAPAAASPGAAPASANSATPLEANPPATTPPAPAPATPAASAPTEPGRPPLINSTEPSSLPQ